MDNLRNKIRKIIKEELDLQHSFGEPDKARRGLIALSKGRIPSSDFNIDFNFASDVPDGTGSYSQEGEIEINYNFEGTKYNVIIYAVGEYYYTPAEFQGNYDSPPDTDEIEPENIIYEEDEITTKDDEGNEFQFYNSDLSSTFNKELQKFLLDYYEPGSFL